jgi:[acyl-carrier-protein] S-malonyltransferase
LTASTICGEILKQHGVNADIAAGHSLGEYSALVNAGAMKFADAVRIVRQRGQFMQEAVPVGEGSMSAVMGLANEKIVEICQQVETETGLPVQAVNFNCPGQVVIAGATAAVDKANEEMKAAGAKRCIVLHVSAPFHSSMMKPASERLAEVLAPIEIKDAVFPVVANVTAEEVVSGALIKELLVKQAAMPVLWETSVRNMVAGGVDTFVEVGPSKVLTGFTKKIAKGVTSLWVEDPHSLEKTLEHFQGGKE